MHTRDERKDALPKMLIATAVVLYFPDSAAIERLKTYSEFVDLLIVIDNTDRVDLSGLFEPLPTVIYSALGENKGIANALNTAAEIAMSKQFPWLMMLDQDSNLQLQMYSAVKESIAKINGTDVALLSPVQVTKESDFRVVLAQPLHREIGRAMTSGSTLSLAAYRKCGPFEDKLFIDHVDNEYCLRLRRAGFKIMQMTHAVLDHSLGEVRTIKFAGIRFQFVSHKPFRSYYFVRNGLYVGFKFFGSSPRFLTCLCFQLFKDVCKAILLQDQKASRLSMMLLGLTHFIGGRFGALGHAKMPRIGRS
jgi:rhamnosyltransferase